MVENQIENDESRIPGSHDSMPDALFAPSYPFRLQLIGLIGASRGRSQCSALPDLVYTDGPTLDNTLPNAPLHEGLHVICRWLYRFPRMG